MSIRVALLAVAILACAGVVHAATVTVSTTADVVNGTVTSPAALNASPGPDGISLREAILATNATAGPHTITFATALAGRGIVLTGPLPPMRRDRVQVLGLADPSGRADITIDARNVAGCCSLATFLVQASNVSFRWLRIVRVQDRSFGIMIRAGRISTPALSGPLVVNNVRVEDSIFDNSAVTGVSPYAVSVGNDADAGVRRATVANVLVARNVFRNFGGDGDSVHVQAGGTDNLILDLVVADNVISDSTFPVELVPLGSDTRIRRTRIVRNRFVRGHQSVTLGPIHRASDPPLTFTLIEDTVIEGNVFDGGANPAIAVNGGHGTASNNVIGGVRIANNVIANHAPFGGILICGGSNGATGNIVRGVRIANTTVTRNGSMIDVLQNCDADSSGNSARRVVIVNSIFWGNAGGFGDAITSTDVGYSILQDRFDGVNGNRVVDPKFVDPDADNFRLMADSPAIDAGSSVGAPATDLACRPRVDDPATANTGVGAPPFYDVGAYEFGAPASRCPAYRMLAVVKLGSGAGDVTATDLVCGADCGGIYPDGTVVTLTAVAAPGSRFRGWGAPSSGTGQCTVTMTAHRTVTARFTPQ